MAILKADTSFYLGKGKAGVMDKYGRQIKTTAWKTAIKMMTGEDPIVNEYDEYTDIEFTDYQVQFLKDKLTEWNKADPGEVRINYKPVLFPWLIKKYWPWAVGAVGVGFVLGALLKLK